MADIDISEDQDPYVAQLHDVFEACDVERSGLLGESELRELSRKLQLEEESLVNQLLKGDHSAKVDFDGFREGIILFLSRLTVAGVDSESQGSDEESRSMEHDGVNTTVDSRKKLYGRRSRRIHSSGNNSDEFDDEVNDSFQQLHQVIIKVERTDSAGSTGSRDSSSEVNKYRRLGRDENQSAEEQPDTFEAEGQLNLNMADVENVSETSAEEGHLRDIWRSLDLDIHEDLTIHELAKVCDHIGMNMDNEELKQLFNRLDHDGDGRVGFEEFHRELFQHGATSGQSGQSLPSTPHSKSPYRRMKVPTPNVNHEDGLRPVTPSLSMCGTSSGIFTMLDVQNTGLAEPDYILGYWESLDVTGGADILASLGFDLHSKISLAELSFLLTQDMASAGEQNSVFKAAVASYQQEFQHTRLLYEQVTAEKNKVRQDLLDANSRNELLVKEADDRHLSMEKSTENKLLCVEQKYQEQIKAFQLCLEEERETFTVQAAQQRQKLENKIEGLKHEEGRVKENLILAQKEIEKLESELTDLSVQLEEAKRHTVKLHKDSFDTFDLDQSLVEDQGSVDSDDVLLFTQAKLQEVQSDNKMLRDRVDELTAEVEELKLCLVMAQKKAHNSRDRSVPPSPGNKRRRHVSTEYLTSEESMDEGPQRISPTEQSDSEGPLLELIKELEQMKNGFEQERKDIEQAFKMEIVEIEEHHDQDRDKLLRSFAREKDKVKEEIEASHTEQLAELEKNLQNDFAEEKQNLIVKHESEKNFMEHKFAEEKSKLSESLKTEYSEDLKLTLAEVNAQHNQEKARLVQNHPIVQKMSSDQADLELKLKLQHEELELRFDRERTEVREKYSLENQQLEAKHRAEIHRYDNMLSQGPEALEGKLREDFNGLLAHQVQEQFGKEKATLLDRFLREKRDITEAHEHEKTLMFQEVEQERSELIQKYESEIARLRAELKTLQENIRIETECQQKNTEREKRQTEKTLSQSIRADLEEGFVVQVQKMRDAFQEERNEMETHQKLLEQEIEELKLSENKAQQELHDVWKQNKAESSQVAQVQEIMDTFEEERSEMMAHQKLLEQEIEELKLSADKTREELDKLRKENRDLLQANNHESFVAQLQEMRNTYEEERCQLESRQKSREHKIEEFRMLASKSQEDLDNLWKQNSELQRANKQLERTVEHQSRELVQLRTDRDNNERVFTARIDQLTTAQEAVQLETRFRAETVQTPNSSEKAANDSLTLEKTNLKDELSRLKGEYVQVESENRDLRKTKELYQQLLRDEGNLEKRLETAERNVLDLTQTAQCLSETQVSLNGALSEKKQLEVDLQTSQEKLREMKEKYDTLPSKDTITGDKIQARFTNGLSSTPKMIKTFDVPDGWDKEKLDLKQELTKTKEQLLAANMSLSRLKADHTEEVYLLRGSTGTAVDVKQLTSLQLQLVESQNKTQRLESRLQQTLLNSNLSLKNSEMLQQHRLEKIEAEKTRLVDKLEKTNSLLEKQTDKYKEQCKKSIKTDLLLKELHVENANLMEALHMTEQRQKVAEQRCYRLEDKCRALNNVVNKVVRAAVVTS